MITNPYIDFLILVEGTLQ